MILLALLLAQATSAPGPWTDYQRNQPPCPNGASDCNWWERYPLAERPQPDERLGPGPHTLVIADGTAITRINYRSGPLCQRARDTIRRQVSPPPNTRNVIYGPSMMRAFCVPR